MWYYIYRRHGKNYQEIGRTKYIEDAKKILDNWHEGYIAYGGDIVFSKNMEN